MDCQFLHKLEYVCVKLDNQYQNLAMRAVNKAKCETFCFKYKVKMFK